MFYISAVSTDYNQIPTGNRDEDFESFVNEHDLEIVERNETTAIVRAEWGNGEGYDEYTVTFPTERTYEITLPMDMLWQDVDSDDYLADATEEGYAAQLIDNLYKGGYKADVSWSTVPSITIKGIDENGDPVSDIGDDYNFIRSIIDKTEVNYIEPED